MVMSSWSSPARRVFPIDRGWKVWRRGWLVDVVDSRETIFIPRRGTIASVLCVQDGSRELRDWLRRLIATDSIRCVRCLGVIDVPMPWYAGLSFSEAELIEAMEEAHAEATRTRDRSTRATALWLERRGVPAVAECHVGDTARTVLTRAEETDPDLIMVHDDGRHRAALRSIVERAECSVLVIREGATNPAIPSPLRAKGPTPARWPGPIEA